MIILGSIISELWDSPILNVVGIMGIPIGIIVAYVFYKKSRRFKRVSFVHRSFNLLSNTVSSLPNFKAEYEGQQLDDLTATKLLLWNSGSEIVLSSDIAESDPLTVRFPEGVSILDAKISSVSKKTNLPKPVLENEDDENKASFRLAFDYFGVREGCILSILHTGKSDAEPHVSGTIKGYGQPIRDWKGRASVFIMWILPIAPGFIVGIVGLYIFTVLNDLGLTWWITGIVLLVVSFPLAAFLTITERFIQNRLNRKVGDALDQVFEDGFASSDFHLKNDSTLPATHKTGHSRNKFF